MFRLVILSSVDLLRSQNLYGNIVYYKYEINFEKMHHQSSGPLIDSHAVRLSIGDDGALLRKLQTVLF